MKNKGFTLIEVLAVVIILGLIAIIVYPNVEKTLKNAKESLYDDQINTIKSEAHNWVADHPYDIPKNNGEELTISLCQLKLETHLAHDISNPKTKKMFDCGTKIKIKKENENEQYTYSVDLTGTKEENIPKELNYPKVSLIGNTLEYIKINDSYDFSTILLENNLVNSDTDQYTVNITTDMISTNGPNSLIGVASSTGSYLVKYELINKSTNLKTVFYKTVIVIGETE